MALADHKVDLFNGKDLSGWTKRGGNGSYKVEDGEIVGRSAPNTTNTFLCTDKEFGDFEMELDFKIDPKQNIFNSGVQIRSHSRPEGDQIQLHDLFVFEQTGVDETGIATGHFTVTGIRPKCIERIESRGISLPGELFLRKQIPV